VVVLVLVLVGFQFLVIGLAGPVVDADRTSALSQLALTLALALIGVAALGRSFPIVGDWVG
jgi:hypothetical protein